MKKNLTARALYVLAQIARLLKKMPRHTIKRSRKKVSRDSFLAMSSAGLTSISTRYRSRLTKETLVVSLLLDLCRYLSVCPDILPSPPADGQIADQTLPDPVVGFRPWSRGLLGTVQPSSYHIVQCWPMLWNRPSRLWSVRLRADYVGCVHGQCNGGATGHLHRSAP